MKAKLRMTLDDLDKSNIWTITSSELSQMIIDGKKRKDEFLENEKHYMNLIRLVFDIQYLKREDTARVSQLEAARFEVFSTTEDGGFNAIAIRKHAIEKVTDLTLENIQHLTAAEVLELIRNNMGTGWKGLPLSVQDIIESAFFVDCTVMPAATMRKPGGIIDRRKEDGYDVLELVKGIWMEGVFMKPRPKVEKVRHDYSMVDDDESRRRQRRAAEEDDDMDDELEDEFVDEEAMDDDDDDMTPEECRQLDGDMDDDMDDMDPDEPDENELLIEDIDAIDDLDEEDE